MPTVALVPPVPLEGPLAPLRKEIQLRRIQTRPEAGWFKGLIGTHHYLGYRQATGGQVKYLAWYRDRPVAALSFGPAAYRVAARDAFIGWSPAQRRERLAWVVNNDRFVLLPWVRVPQLASFVLSRCLRRLAGNWREVYQQESEANPVIPSTSARPLDQSKSTIASFINSSVARWMAPIPWR